MTLVNPKIGYKTIRDAIITYYRANLVALNVGLTAGKTFTSSTTQIIVGNPNRKPIMASVYPVIMVGINSKEEEWSQAVRAGAKRPVISYSIYALVRVFNDDVASENEIMTLTDNIEGLLRNDPQLNSTMLWVSPSSTEFLVNADNKTYVGLSVINIDVVQEVK